MENTGRDYNLAVQRDSKGLDATELIGLTNFLSLIKVSESPCCP
jgi:hypothetical protein